MFKNEKKKGRIGDWSCERGQNYNTKRRGNEEAPVVSMKNRQRKENNDRRKVFPFPLLLIFPP